VPLKYQPTGSPPAGHPAAPQGAQPAPKQGMNTMAGADKYRGAIAEGYDKKRESQPRWIAEQQIIETALRMLPDGSTVLDAPIGTNRFIDVIREKGHKLIGLDISEDMLRQAQTKVTPEVDTMLLHGPVWETGLQDNSVDMALMIRITRWLDPDQRILALKEMQRVSKGAVVFTARVADHPHAYTRQQINEAVDLKEFASAWDYGASEENYRVMCLGRRDSMWFKDGVRVELPVPAQS